MRVEVVLGEPRRGGDRRRDLALVERVRPFRRDSLQGGRELGQRVALAGARARATVRARPAPTCRRSAPSTRCRRGPPSAAGATARVEAEATEALGEVGPQPYGAGHRHRLRAVVLERPAAEVGRGAAGAVDAVQRALVPDEREGVAADPVVGRLRDRQHGGGRERRVDRVAAALERAQAGAGRERMARRDHRLGADRGHPPPAARARPGPAGRGRRGRAPSPRASHVEAVEGPVPTVYTGVMSPPPHPFDVDETQRALVDRGGGYEVVHTSPGLEIGVYVLVAPEPDRQQPHDEDEVYVVLEGSGDARGRGHRRLRSRRAWRSSSRPAPSTASPPTSTCAARRLQRPALRLKGCFNATGTGAERTVSWQINHRSVYTF